MGENLLHPPGPLRFGPPQVVGVIHDGASLRAALALTPGASDAPDVLELRADGFAPANWRRGWPHELLNTPGLLPFLQRPPRRLILTVRDPREGGARRWLRADRRAELLRGLWLEAGRGLPRPACVDLELRNFARPAFQFLVNPEARSDAGGTFIASFHDFKGTPPARRLRELAGRAAALGADLFKVAAHVRGPGDLARLLEFLETERRLPLAVMGMGGALGLASRPVLAVAGSALNYGYLGDAPAVSGQWPVALLRARIDELLGAAAVSPAAASDGKGETSPG